jgi:methionyl-tRNA formyltransferase
MKPRVIVLGEKPQGVTWLKLLIESDLFNIIGGVPRKGYKNAWWGSDEFSTLLKHYEIPELARKDLYSIDYDIIWSLMYGYIIEPELIKKAQWFGINLHESPLPRYRGCNGCSHSIENGDSTYGTTLQILGEELDSGGIIDQEIYPIMEDETSKELYERTKMVSNIIFKRNLKKISEKSFIVTPINVSEEPIRKRTSLSTSKNINGYPDIRRAVRSLDFIPFEPAYYIKDNKKYYLFINNSMGRLYHSYPQDQRSIIEMSEEIYKKTYPLFIPESQP